MKKFLHSILILIIIFGVIWLAYSNYAQQKTVAALQQNVQTLQNDAEILKQGHNQILINTQNIAILAKIMNPDIDKTLPQAPIEDRVIQPEASTMPAVQNSSATAN